MDLGDLAGKVVLVTGGSRGIGAAVARGFAHHGAHVAVHYNAARDAAEKIVAAARKRGVRAEALQADLSDAAAPARLVAETIARFGRVDVLINNAGLLVAGPLETIDLDQLAQMTRVNFDAVVRSSYTFARAFKAQGKGAIVNVSSIGAYLSNSSMGVYGGLKHALEVFTTALRVELKGSGVRVGSIAPGTTDTEVFDHLRACGQPVRADLSTALSPADVAAAVRFMLERPAHANVGRMLLVSSSEMA